MGEGGGGVLTARVASIEAITLYFTVASHRPFLCTRTKLFETARLLQPISPNYLCSARDASDREMLGGEIFETVATS